MRLFALTYITRWFSFATQSYMLAVEKSLPAALISVSTALVFPMILIASCGTSPDGLWLNFALTALLAAVLSGVLLFLLRRQPVAAGRRTRTARRAFGSAGGRRLDVTECDGMRRRSGANRGAKYVGSLKKYKRTDDSVLFFCPVPFPVCDYTRIFRKKHKNIRKTGKKFCDLYGFIARNML